MEASEAAAHQHRTRSEGLAAAESPDLLPRGLWVLVGDPGHCGEAAGACPALELCQWQGQGIWVVSPNGICLEKGDKGTCAGWLLRRAGNQERREGDYRRRWMGLKASGAGGSSRRSLWNDKTRQRDRSRVPAYKCTKHHRSN